MIEKLDVYNKNKEKTGKIIERNPKEKDVIIDLVMNFLNNE